MNVVNRVLNRKSETKYASSRAGDTQPHVYTITNSVIAGAAAWQSAIPGVIVSTSADDWTRVGDTISPTRSRVDLELKLIDPAGSPPGTYSSPAPWDITAYIVYGYCKRYRNITDVNGNSAALASALLKLGGKDGTGAEYTSFGGYAEDADLIINDAVWHLRVKKVRLFKSPGQLNGVVSPGTISTPNKNSAKVVLNYSKMLPSKFKYQGDADLYPTNFAPVFSIGYYYNDGTPADTGSTGVLKYKATKHLFFKDM